MTRDLISKLAFRIFLKLRSYPNKGMGKGGRREILNFPFIQVFLPCVDSYVKVVRKTIFEKEHF